MQKRSYSAPRLTVHGTIESVTRSTGRYRNLDNVYPGSVNGPICDPVPGTPYSCGNGDPAS